MKNLNNQNEIRIIINRSRGFGHQSSAITIMNKLRDLGFIGTFDIHFKEFLPEPSWELKNKEFLPGLFLKLKNKEFLPKPSSELKNYDERGYVEKSLRHLFYKKLESFDLYPVQEFVDHPIFGSVRISRLPNIPSNQRSFNLNEIELTISGGNDWWFLINDHCARYNTKTYVQLQPTDWDEWGMFIQQEQMKKYHLPLNLRLSEPVKCDNSESKIPNPNFKRKTIYELTKVDSNTQLVYGVYKSLSSLDPVLEWLRLLQAHEILQQKTDKRSLIFFPQEICKQHDFQGPLNKRFKLSWYDMTSYPSLLELSNSSLTHIICMDKMSKPTFNWLMSEGTTLPPVIEGCNSRETCEYMGWPFIWGGSQNESLIEYPVDNQYTDFQKLHKLASRCLQTGSEENVPDLTNYMLMSLRGELNSYHENRRHEYLKRPDAVEFVLKELGYEIKQLHILTSAYFYIPLSIFYGLFSDEINNFLLILWDGCLKTDLNTREIISENINMGIRSNLPWSATFIADTIHNFKKKLKPYFYKEQPINLEKKQFIFNFGISVIFHPLIALMLNSIVNTIFSCKERPKEEKTWQQMALGFVKNIGSTFFNTIPGAKTILNSLQQQEQNYHIVLQKYSSSWQKYLKNENFDSKQLDEAYNKWVIDKLCESSKSSWENYKKQHKIKYSPHQDKMNQIKWVKKEYIIPTYNEISSIESKGRFSLN